MVDYRLRTVAMVYFGREVCSINCHSLIWQGGLPGLQLSWFILVELALKLPQFNLAGRSVWVTAGMVYFGREV